MFAIAAFKEAIIIPEDFLWKKETAEKMSYKACKKMLITMGGIIYIPSKYSSVARILIISGAHKAPKKQVKPTVIMSGFITILIVGKSFSPNLEFIKGENVVLSALQNRIPIDESVAEREYIPALSSPSMWLIIILSVLPSTTELR